MKKLLPLLLILSIVGCASEKQPAEDNKAAKPENAVADSPSSAKLTTCPDCDGKVSKRASQCPHCGAPLKPTGPVDEADKARPSPAEKAAAERLAADKVAAEQATAKAAAEKVAAEKAVTEKAAAEEVTTEQATAKAAAEKAAAEKAAAEKTAAKPQTKPSTREEHPSPDTVPFAEGRSTSKRVIILRGHASFVSSVAFSPDGKRLASASYRTVKLWDVATGQEVLTLNGHILPVTSVAFSPDGKRLASASEDRTIKLWDVATGQEVLTLNGHILPVTSVAFSPDGKRLASASEDRTIKLWDVATGQEVLLFTGHTGTITSVAWSPDGKRIVSGSGDKTLKVWDTTSGQETLTLKGHSSTVRSVSFSPDGKQIVSGSEDKTVKVWDAGSGKETLTIKRPYSPVWSVSFSPDGKQIVSGGRDKTLKVWDAETGQLTRILKGHSDWVCSVAFSPDGKRIASGSHDKTGKVWDRSTGQALLTLKGHGDAVTRLVFSPDGTRLASASADKTVKTWDVATGEVLYTLLGHTRGFANVAFSPNGRQLVTCDISESDRYRYRGGLWDATTGREAVRLAGHSPEPNLSAFSPSGKTLVSADNDGVVTLWDTGSGKELLKFNGLSESIHQLTFSPDGTQIATASSDKIVRLWDATTGKALHELKGHSGRVSFVAFSPDSRRVATGSSDKTAKIWDARTGKDIVTLPGHTGGLDHLVFSPDGTLLATADFSRSEKDDETPAVIEATVRLWDLASGEPRTVDEVRGSRGLVCDLAFSDDGTRLFALRGRGPYSVAIWDVRSGRRLAHHTTEIVSTHRPICFTPNRQGVVFAGASESLSPDLDIGARLAHSNIPLSLFPLSPIDPVPYRVDRWNYKADSRSESETKWTKIIAFPPSTRSVALSLDGTRLVAWQHEPLRTVAVKAWDAETGRETNAMEAHSALGGANGVGVSFSSDGHWLVTATNADNTMKLWDVTTLAEKQVLQRRNNSGLTHVAVSRDGRLLAANSRFPGPVQLWYVTTRQVLYTLMARVQHGTGLTFSPDGQHLAVSESSASGHRVSLWNTTTGHHVTTIKDGSRVIAFSPDSKRLATGRFSEITLWNLEHGQKLATARINSTNIPGLAPHAFSVSSIRFGPSGQLAIGGTEGAVIIIPAGDGEVWDAPPTGPHGFGTGFFITTDGYLMTNHHVIAKATHVSIKTDKGELPATVIKVDKQHDLAVLKVKGTFNALPLASSRKVRLGDPIMTVGFPAPTIQGFSSKLTRGSINSLAGFKDDPVLFQISAPVQPGNSGGPLVDATGNVVGLIVSRLDGKRYFSVTGALPQNVNYAIKSSYARSFLESLPKVVGNLVEPHPRTRTREFSDVVKETEKATVMLLVK